MARVNYVKKAQQRFKTVPVLDDGGLPQMTPVMDKRTGTQKTDKRGKPVFMRVTVADKDQPLPNHTCGKCGVEIRVGDSYKHVTVKSGPYGGRTMYRCHACPSWRQSELTTSKMAGVYAAQEHLDDTIDNVDTADDLRGLASDVAEMIREVSNEYRESQENMESGFGHPTSMSDELGEKADNLEGWADDIDSWEPDSEEPEEDSWDEEEIEDDEDFQSAHDDWLEEARDSLRDLVNDCPV